MTLKNEKTGEEIHSVRILGRRWFQKTYGNTYFSAVAIVNGKEVAKIDYEYGYGDQYLHSITDRLETLGYMPGRVHNANGSADPAWYYFRDLHKVAFTYGVVDVQRKKDL
jgi:hypothetical protein